jgi:hypothetical protein
MAHAASSRVVAPVHASAASLDVVQACGSEGVAGRVLPPLSRLRAAAHR